MLATTFSASASAGDLAAEAPGGLAFLAPPLVRGLLCPALLLELAKYAFLDELPFQNPDCFFIVIVDYSYFQNLLPMPLQLDYQRLNHTHSIKRNATDPFQGRCDIAALNRSALISEAGGN